MVTHPANWGPYKIDCLWQAIRMATLDQLCPVSLMSEPEAAAAYYASTERLDPGDVIAVYDLGGGTFDAAVLRRTDTGWEFLAPAEGIERLGGIDFDEAVLAHVDAATDGQVHALDPTDTDAMAALLQLRRDCVDAKEALSSDIDATIRVALPNYHADVRLTRAEFEAMVEPSVRVSVDALQRVLRSAGVTPDQLHAVLLVGGSSRIPLVSQIVGQTLHVPVAVDAHPKHSIALGAALTAGNAPNRTPSSAASTPTMPPPPNATPAAGRERSRLRSEPAESAKTAIRLLRVVGPRRPRRRDDGCCRIIAAVVGSWSSLAGGTVLALIRGSGGQWGAATTPPAVDERRSCHPRPRFNPGHVVRRHRQRHRVHHLRSPNGPTSDESQAARSHGHDLTNRAVDADRSHLRPRRGARHRSDGGGRAQRRPG